MTFEEFERSLDDDGEANPQIGTVDTRVWVVAGNKPEAEQYRKARGIKASDFQYAWSTHCLHGLMNSKVVLTGTYGEAKETLRNSCSISGECFATITVDRLSKEVQANGKHDQ